MKRIIIGVLAVSSALVTGCGKDIYKVPEGRPGSMNVSGAVRARSDHYQIIGTLSPTGGAHSSASHQLNDGVFSNKTNK